VVIGDTIVLSSLREEPRRGETAVTRPVLERYGLRVLAPDRGFVEGGDVFVDGDRIWVGLGSRTDDWGAEWLHRTFGRDFDVIPLRFGPIHTHLDTVFGIVGRHALVYEPAFEAAALEKIRAGFADIVPLTDKEQLSAGANVLSLGRQRVLGTEGNASVNEKLRLLGYEVVTVPFSEVTKSGGSVRCDALPVEREFASVF
jgi:N-dimethylarginine dimethylaminohydrolase